MAALYGTLTGNGASVTRTGTKASGIRSQVQTHSAAVAVSLADDDTARIVAKHPRTGAEVEIWSGNVADLLANK